MLHCIFNMILFAINHSDIPDPWHRINAKLGGLNHTPVFQDISCLQISSTMIIGLSSYITFVKPNINTDSSLEKGIDVSHPGPGVQRPSVASVVVSVDKDLTHYTAATSIQEPRCEIVVNLAAMLKVCCPTTRKMKFNWWEDLSRKLYQDSTHTGSIFTSRILGQSTSSFSGMVFLRVNSSLLLTMNSLKWRVSKVQPSIRHSYDFFLDLITERLSKSKIPKVTFIVVGKRHHIRFAPSQVSTGDASGNCPPGFVANDKISMPGIHDFYLQSHGGLLGSEWSTFHTLNRYWECHLASRPGHYIVVKDENGFEANQ